MKEIEGLLLFAKVVELKSFAEASRQLNQPSTSVSRKIQQLENELGGKLLNRTTRSLSLTELGERVLPKAQLLESTIEELKSEADDFSSQPIGTLYISAPRAFCQDMLAPLLAKFRQQYPSIKIELEASNRFQDMAKSRLDFVFRVGMLADSSLIALPLSTVNYALVASQNLLAQFKTISHPKELERLPTIRNQVDGFILPWHFSCQKESYSLQSAPDLLSDDLIVSLTYALEGVGVAYLPVSLAQRYIDNERLVTLLPKWQKQAPTAYLLYQDKKNLPQKSKVFIEFIRAHKPHFMKILAQGTC